MSEDGDIEPPTVPQQGANPHGPPMSPCPPVPEHSPAPLWLRPARQGRAPLGDPWRGGERRCRGVSTAPPGAVPAWQQDLGTACGVCDLCQPAGTLLGPCWDPSGTCLGSLHPCRHRGQCPGVVGTLKPWRCHPGGTESSALGGLRGVQPGAPRPPSRVTRGQPGAPWGGLVG